MACGFNFELYTFVLNLQCYIYILDCLFRYNCPLDIFPGDIYLFTCLRASHERGTMKNRKKFTKYFLNSRAVSGRVSFDIELQSEWTFPCHFSWLVASSRNNFCHDNVLATPLHDHYWYCISDFGGNLCYLAFFHIRRCFVRTALVTVNWLGLVWTLWIATFFILHLHVSTVKPFTETKNNFWFLALYVPIWLIPF